MMRKALIIVIGIFSCLSCSRDLSIEYVKSGNEIILNNGAIIQLINSANSQNNKSLLNAQFLFQEVMLTDINHQPIEVEEDQIEKAYVFLNDGKLINDFLEKERFAGAEIDVEDSDTNGQIVSPEINSEVPATNNRILPEFDNNRWSNVDVKGTKDVSQCYEFVQDVFHKHDIINLPHIPVIIISRSEMTKLSGNVSTVGLAYTQSWDDGTLIHKILVVENLPRLDFTQVLAHEILHTWVKQNNVKLDEITEEGLCNYASYLILIEVENDYAKQLITDMMLNPDPVYGGGFRCVKKEVEENGLKSYLSQLLEA